MTTKERITEEALTLFSQNGFKGTSVKRIAEAVGIRDASLYKHFAGKQEIFDSIVTLIQGRISSLSQILGIPRPEEQEMLIAFYERISVDSLIVLSRKIFLFYLTDSYISRFWRLSHLEQYQNPKIYGMFRQIFFEDAVSYQTWLFSQFMERGIFCKGDARAAAVNFYAPVFLLLTMYAGHEEKKDEALTMLDGQIREFARIYRMMEKKS